MDRSTAKLHRILAVIDEHLKEENCTHSINDVLRGLENDKSDRI